MNSLSKTQDEEWHEVDPFEISTFPKARARCLIELHSGLRAYAAMIRYGYMSFLLNTWQALPPVPMAKIKRWQYSPRNGGLYDPAMETANLGEVE